MAYNTTGYRPDPVLAQQMAGGGFGSLMTHLGGAFDKLYQTANANDQWKAEQKIRELNALTGQRHASANEMNAKINADRLGMQKKEYDKGIEDSIHNDYRAVTNQANYLSQYGDKSHGYGVPTLEEFKSMGADGRTPFLAHMSSLENSVKDKLANEAAEQERLNKLSDEKLAHLRDLEKIDYKAKAEGKSTVGFSWYTGESGKNYQAAKHPKTGQLITPDGKIIQEPVSEYRPVSESEKLGNESKNIELENKRLEADAIVKQEVNKAFTAFEDTWEGSEILDMWGDKDQLKKEAQQHAYSMIQSGKTRGMSYADIAKEAYKRAGGEMSLLSGVSITPEKQRANFVTSIINGADPSKITPDIVAQFYDINGEQYDSETIKFLTELHKMSAQERLNKVGSVDEFNRRYKLDSNFAERFWDGAKDQGSNVMNWFGEKGLLSAGDAKRWKERAENPTGGGDNWAIANQQMDFAPIAVEILKYAPTIGLSPVQLSTRLGTIVANAGKFGTADAALAEIYGDNIPLAGGAAATAGALVGLFARLGIKVTKGSKAEQVYNQWNKTMNDKYNASGGLDRPSYQRK